MRAGLRWGLSIWAASVLAGCGPGDAKPEPEPYVWNLPPGFPTPDVPEDNPMSTEKVELGRRLFYDPRLSGNETQSCGSCHRQELAFTDGLANAVGSTGEHHRRRSMSLTNVAFNATLTFGPTTEAAVAQPAKLIMMIQAVISLIVTTVLLARAVGG